MPKLQWDVIGERLFETGTSHGVLFVQSADGTYGNGVAWSGLTAVNLSPSGAEEEKIYADNIHYLSLTSAEEFGFTIEAYSSPEEFDVCDGQKEVAPGLILHQQPRSRFGFVFETKIGNDIQGDKFGKKIHVIYNAKAGVSEMAYATVNDSPEAITLSWECSTTAVPVDGHEYMSYIEIDCSKMDAATVTAIENLLYGSTEPDGNAKLPTPAELIALATA